MKTFLAFLLFSSFFSFEIHARSPLEGLPQHVINLHKALTAGNECEIESYDGPVSFDIGNQTSLHLIPCFSGPYNVTYLAYASTNSSAEPISTLAYNSEHKVLSPNLWLVNASFDPKTKTLYTYYKGRGIADCGQSSETRILGIDSAATILIRNKAKCDGKETAWPVVFRQKIKK